MLDPNVVQQAAPPVQVIPWGTVTLWVLGSLSAIGIVVASVGKSIWSTLKDKDEKLVNAHLARAVSAEKRAEKAEEQETEARRQYDRLKGEFKATARALRIARRQEEIEMVGQAISSPPPRGDASEEPTITTYAESAKDRAFYEEREREREHKRLNPDTFAREERERHRADPLLRRYLTPEHGTPNSSPPPRKRGGGE